MLITTIVIVAIVLVGCIVMSSVQISHINRAAVAMFCGVSAWVVYMLHGADFLNLMGYPDYQLGGLADDYIATNVIIKYINEACRNDNMIVTTTEQSLYLFVDVDASPCVEGCIGFLCI